MFCHFNVISLSTVIIEGWQVIYKPIKIWVANKSPLHSSLWHVFQVTSCPQYTCLKPDTCPPHVILCCHPDLTSSTPRPLSSGRSGPLHPLPRPQPRIIGARLTRGQDQTSRGWTRWGNKENWEHKTIQNEISLLLGFSSAISWNVLSMQWKYPVIWGIFKFSE